MDWQHLKYEMTAFRTKKSYLFFLIAQLALAIVIIPIALTSPNHFRTPSVIFLEFVLFLLFAFDLLIVRLISEGTLCRNKSNIFDLAILTLFAATLIFLVVSSQDTEKDYRQLLQDDDIAILAIVMSRYIMQVLSLIRVIRKARTNRALYDEFKKVDLNAKEQENNISINFNDEHRADNIVKDKIKQVFSEEL